MQRILSPPSLGCAPSVFSSVGLPGADIQAVQAAWVTNFTKAVPEYFNFNHPATRVADATFCNVTVTYSHPDHNDTIHVEAWLPDAASWNGRLEAIGGGGWVAGRFFLTYYGMAGALADGYATVTTDAGLGAAMDASEWGLMASGAPNLAALGDLAATSLGDLGVLGRQLVGLQYGRPPRYAYWSGCSQGGRQGLMLAQRYPDLFDGIVASAPAIHMDQFVPASLWPAVVMHEAQAYPHPCEIDAIRAAAVDACDAADGVVDGLISDPAACRFDAYTMVGKDVDCAGAVTHISPAAALVANASWTGPVAVADGASPLWPGPEIGSDIEGDVYNVGGIAQTTCDADGRCAPVPFALATQWIQYFVAKNASYDATAMTRAQFEAVLQQSHREYAALFGTADPDLSAFQARGGKMLAYHGTIDGIIPIKATERYYDAVTAALDADVHDFFRLFPVPGIAHCYGGNGGLPTGIFDALVAWVENGTAPASLPVHFTDPAGTVNRRIVCPYPSLVRYNATCGDSTAEACFDCH